MIEKIKKLDFDNSPPFSNVLGVKRNSPGLLFLTNPRFNHRWATTSSLTNPRLTALKKNISKESGEVQVPKSVKTTDYDPGSKSKVKKSVTL